MDIPDGLAIRSLLLDIIRGTAGCYVPVQAFLKDALQRQVENGVWIGGVSLFESVVLDPKEADPSVTSDARADAKATWATATNNALEKLDAFHLGDN